MNLLNELERARAIESNIEALEAEMDAYSRLFAGDERETARQHWNRLKRALKGDIERNRQKQAAYNSYIDSIRDEDVKKMLQLHLNGISWAKIYAIVYGYSNGGTGANYCYKKVTRYLQKHPMKRKDDFMNYEEVKELNQQDFNAFPLGFAFNERQLKESMERLGVTSENELLSIGGGGFIRKTDRAAFLDLLERTGQRVKDGIDSDPDGLGFIKGMFFTELANHEYCYSGDLSETLEAVGITMQEIEESPKLAAGLKAALQEYAAAGYE